MKSFCHRNIARLFASYYENKTIVTIMEVCQSDLRMFIHGRNKVPLPVDTILSFSCQMLCGLNYLHERNIVHRDIKPAVNFFHLSFLKQKLSISEYFDYRRCFENHRFQRVENCDRVSTFCLKEFKFKTFLTFVNSDWQMMETFTGTKSYMSPQVLKGKGYNKRTDVWSLGLVFIELIILEPHKVETIKFVGPLQPSSIPISDTRLEPIRKCICSKMIVSKDHDRCSVEQVINDVAFRNHFPFVEAKAKAWLYDEALVEMENQQLEMKIVDVESKLRQELDETKKQLDETKVELNVMNKELDQTKTRVDETEKELDNAKKQLDETKKQLDEERQKRRKLQESIDKSNDLVSTLKKQVEKLEKQQKQQNQPVGERFQAEFENMAKKLQFLEQRLLANEMNQHDNGNGWFATSSKSQAETSETKKKDSRKSKDQKV